MTIKRRMEFPPLKRRAREREREREREEGGRRTERGSVARITYSIKRGNHPSRSEIHARRVTSSGEGRGGEGWVIREADDRSGSARLPCDPRRSGRSKVRSGAGEGAGGGRWAGGGGENGRAYFLAAITIDCRRCRVTRTETDRVFRARDSLSHGIAIRARGQAI